MVSSAPLTAIQTHPIAGMQCAMPLKIKHSVLLIVTLTLATTVYASTAKIQLCVQVIATLIAAEMVYVK